MRIKFLLIFILSTNVVFSRWEMTNWINYNDIDFIASSEGSVMFYDDYVEGYRFSNDNGNSWISIKIPQYSYIGYTCTYLNGNTIYLGSYGYLLFSSDYGKTWEIRDVGFTINKILVVDDKIFLGIDNGVLISSDNGNTFNFKSSGLPSLWVNSFASIGNNVFVSIGWRNNIYLTTDFGESWSLKNNGLDTLAFYNKFAVTGSKIFTASFENSDFDGGRKKIYLSTDMGSTWIEKNNSILIDVHTYSITAIHDRLFVAYMDSLFVSDDFGETWLTISLTEDAHRGAHILSASNDLIYAGSGTEIFKSSDKGNTWIPIRNNQNYGGANALLSRNNRLYVATADLKNYSTNPDGLYYSPDNGDSWVKYGFMKSAVYVLKQNKKSLFVGTSNGLYRSDNDGKSWKLLFDSIMVYSIVIEEEKILLPYGGGYYISTDNGDTWKFESNELLKCSSIHNMYVKDDFMIAYGNRSFCISYDNGENWEERSNGLPQRVNGPIKIIDNTIYLGTFFGIFTSTNDGLSWESRNNGLPQRQDSLLEVITFVNAGNTLFAGIRFVGVYYTKDNGLNWIDVKCEILKNNYIGSLEIHGDYLFFGTNFFEFGKYGDAIYRAKLSEFGITSVNEQDKSNIIIFPNPASDYITIQFHPSEGLEPSEGYRVQIFDMLGLEVAQTPSPVNNMKNTQTGASELLRIDVSHLPAGVYFIKITCSNGACSIVEKFVKM